MVGAVAKEACSPRDGLKGEGGWTREKEEVLGPETAIKEDPGGRTPLDPTS